MNCNDALELMLDAEPEELALAVESPLVDHIRGCAKCAAVARRLTGATRAIAKVVAVEPQVLVTAGARVTRRRWTAGAGAALAAAAAIVVVVTSGAEPDAPVSSTALETFTTTPAAVVPTAPVAGPQKLARRAAPTPSARMAAAQPVRAVAYVAARVPAPPVAEVALAPRNAERPGGISVAPPAGVRATVMATSDPTVTVVWLHPADTTRSPR